MLNSTELPRLHVKYISKKKTFTRLETGLEPRGFLRDLPNVAMRMHPVRRHATASVTSATAVKCTALLLSYSLFCGIVGGAVVPQKERQALWSWKQGFSGSPPPQLRSWDLLASPCSWMGIGCDEDGHISEVQLNSADLSGPLPREFSFLTALKTLDLGNNVMDGSLPSHWSTMGDLESLSAAGNLLSGTLPVAWSRMYSIRWLTLSNNSFTGTLPRSALPPPSSLSLQPTPQV